MTLMIATGAADFAVHEDEDLRHLEVSAPAALAAMAPFLSRLIARERPAHLTWRLTFAPEEAP